MLCIVNVLLTGVLLDATYATNLVGYFGVVLEALEQFATYTDSIYGNKVSGVRTRNWSRLT